EAADDRHDEAVRVVRILPPLPDQIAKDRPVESAENGEEHEHDHAKIKSRALEFCWSRLDGARCVLVHGAGACLGVQGSTEASPRMRKKATRCLCIPAPLSTTSTLWSSTRFALSRAASNGGLGAIRLPHRRNE